MRSRCSTVLFPPYLNFARTSWISQTIPRIPPSCFPYSFSGVTSASKSAASRFLISIGPSVLASRMQMAIQDGQVASVNVGRPREITVGDAIVRTSIWKDPVAGRIAVRDVNLAGDDQSDRRVHG